MICRSLTPSSIDCRLSTMAAIFVITHRHHHHHHHHHHQLTRTADETLRTAALATNNALLPLLLSEANPPHPSVVTPFVYFVIGIQSPSNSMNCLHRLAATFLSLLHPLTLFVIASTNPILPTISFVENNNNRKLTSNCNAMIPSAARLALLFQCFLLQSYSCSASKQATLCSQHTATILAHLQNTTIIIIIIVKNAFCTCHLIG